MHFSILFLINRSGRSLGLTLYVVVHSPWPLSVTWPLQVQAASTEVPRRWRKTSRRTFNELGGVILTRAPTKHFIQGGNWSFCTVAFLESSNQLRKNKRQDAHIDGTGGVRGPCEQEIVSHESMDRDDRTHYGSRFEWSGEIIALGRDTEQSKVTLQWEHAKSLLSMHCNVSMGIERKFFLDAYK